MSSKTSDSVTIQKNGYIVMDALHALKSPATLQRLINHIAELHNLKSDKIREPIKTVLTTGLDNGFLERHNGRYSICGLHNYDECNNDNYDQENYAERTDSEELDPCCPPKKRRRRQCSRPRTRPRPRPCCRRPQRKRCK